MEANTVDGVGKGVGCGLEGRSQGGETDPMNVGEVHTNFGGALTNIGKGLTNVGEGNVSRGGYFTIYTAMQETRNSEHYSLRLHGVVHLEAAMSANN